MPRDANFYSFLNWDGEGLEQEERVKEEEEEEEEREAAPATTESTSGERDVVNGKNEQTKVNPHKLAVGEEEEARGLSSFRLPRPLERARLRRQACLLAQAWRANSPPSVDLSPHQQRTTRS